VIPEEAVEAAVNAHGRANNPKWDHPIFGYQTFSDAQKGHLRDHARIYLEAAHPILLSHEREEARLAHVDAVVNAETVDRLEKELAEAREESVVSEERRVPIHRTSESMQSYKNIPEQQVTVATVEDLETICVKYGDPIILTVGKDGKLESIEIYDDDRE